MEMRIVNGRMKDRIFFINSLNAQQIKIVIMFTKVDVFKGRRASDV